MTAISGHCVCSSVYFVRGTSAGGGGEVLQQNKCGNTQLCHQAASNMRPRRSEQPPAYVSRVTTATRAALIRQHRPRHQAMNPHRTMPQPHPTCRLPHMKASPQSQIRINCRPNADSHTASFGRFVCRLLQTVARGQQRTLADCCLAPCHTT